MELRIHVTGTIVVLHKVVTDDSMTTAEQSGAAAHLNQEAEKIGKAADAVGKSADALKDLT